MTNSNLLREAAIQAGRLVTFENGEEMIPQDFELGWTAGVLSQQKPHLNFGVMIDDRLAFERKLEAERARSAKLIEALKMICDSYSLDSSVGMKLEAANAIAKYEVNRD